MLCPVVPRTAGSKILGLHVHNPLTVFVSTKELFLESIIASSSRITDCKILASHEHNLSLLCYHTRVITCQYCSPRVRNAPGETTAGECEQHNRNKLHVTYTLICLVAKLEPDDTVRTCIADGVLHESSV